MQLWFINSLFVNIEVWHNVLKKDIDSLVDLDKYLMKKILNVHSKAPIELLYLETSAIRLNFILAGRRINYLHNILIKDSNELVKRVYIAQKENPQKGDWYKLLQDDMKLFSLNSRQVKNIVKKCIKSAAFNALKEIQSEHTNVKEIIYTTFTMQPYMKSNLLSSEEMSTLYNLRADTVNGY